MNHSIEAQNLPTFDLSLRLWRNTVAVVTQLLKKTSECNNAESEFSPEEFIFRFCITKHNNTTKT
jgi:hypothetical protein